MLHRSNIVEGWSQGKVIDVQSVSEGGVWCGQLAFLSEGELEARMARLDAEMEADIEQLRARYERKRRPILDAIHLKRKRQQNF